MRTAATHGSSVVPGQFSVAGVAVPPSSTMRADALDGSTRAAASTNVRRIRFMTGVETRPSAWCCGLRLAQAPGVARCAAPRSLVPIGDSPPVEVVRRQFDLDPVARQDADVVTPHLARNMA